MTSANSDINDIISFYQNKRKQQILNAKSAGDESQEPSSLNQTSEQRDTLRKELMETHKFTQSQEETPVQTEPEKEVEKETNVQILDISDKLLPEPVHEEEEIVEAPEEEVQQDEQLPQVEEEVQQLEQVEEESPVEEAPQPIQSPPAEATQPDSEEKLAISPDMCFEKDVLEKEYQLGKDLLKKAIRNITKSTLKSLSAKRNLETTDYETIRSFLQLLELSNTGEIGD